MKNKRSNPSSHKPNATLNTKSKRLWWIVAVFIIAGTGVILWQYKPATQNTDSIATAPAPTNLSDKIEKDLLIGRWVRTDSEGNYIIEIRSASADGTLEANYFNPNPIKVGHAEWQQKNSSLVIVVELRDVNYPGSTYTLNFLPKENRMTGNYFQAVEGTNFDVEFAREK